MEAFRLQPPMPFATREVARPATLGGYKVPPGCLVHVSHRNANVSSGQFRDADDFKPERFLEEDVGGGGGVGVGSSGGGANSPGSDTFAPFGVGPRFCAGCVPDRLCLCPCLPRAQSYLDARLTELFRAWHFPHNAQLSASDCEHKSVCITTDMGCARSRAQFISLWPQSSLPES
jgi:cytochrome P450